MIHLIRSNLNLPKLQLQIRPEWSSAGADSRNLIRQELLSDLKKITDISAVQARRILDLKHQPEMPGFSISISHCKIAGGYIFNNGLEKIGFDIEEISRVTPETVKRISSSSEELEKAPSATSLWVAKEAAFKCLASSYDLKLIQQVVVGNWQRAGEKSIDLFELVSFKDKNSVTPQNLGCVITQENVKLAIFSS